MKFNARCIKPIFQFLLLGKPKIIKRSGHISPPINKINAIFCIQKIKPIFISSHCFHETTSGSLKNKPHYRYMPECITAPYYKPWLTWATPTFLPHVLCIGNLQQKHLCVADFTALRLLKHHDSKASSLQPVLRRQCNRFWFPFLEIEPLYVQVVSDSLSFVQD